MTMLILLTLVLGVAAFLLNRRRRKPKAPIWVRNDLSRGRHRNMKCLCGSGLKAKRCCGQFRALPIQVAGAVHKALKDRDDARTEA
jgi:hypothetical protein